MHLQRCLLGLSLNLKESPRDWFTSLTFPIKDLNSALNFLVVSENSLEDLLISSVKSAI